MPSKPKTTLAAEAEAVPAGHGSPTGHQPEQREGVAELQSVADTAVDSGAAAVLTIKHSLALPAYSHSC